MFTSQIMASFQVCVTRMEYPGKKVLKIKKKTNLSLQLWRLKEYNWVILLMQSVTRVPGWGSRRSSKGIKRLLLETGSLRGTPVSDWQLQFTLKESNLKPFQNLFSLCKGSIFTELTLDSTSYGYHDYGKNTASNL